MKKNHTYFHIRCAVFLTTGVLLWGIGPGCTTSYAHNLSESPNLYGTWEKDEKGWWFSNQGNPNWPASQWGEYQNHSYYFDETGYMATGWRYLDGHWYYFNPSSGKNQGIMMTGWVHDSQYNGWFYLNSNGIMVTGWHKIDGFWYYFNPSPNSPMGLMATNQVVDNAYVDSKGRMDESPD